MRVLQIYVKPFSKTTAQHGTSSFPSLVYLMDGFSSDSPESDPETEIRVWDHLRKLWEGGRKCKGKGVLMNRLLLWTTCTQSHQALPERLHGDNLELFHGWVKKLGTLATDFLLSSRVEGPFCSRTSLGPPACPTGRPYSTPQNTFRQEISRDHMLSVDLPVDWGEIARNQQFAIRTLSWLKISRTLSVTSRRGQTPTRDSVMVIPSPSKNISGKSNIDEHTEQNKWATKSQLGIGVCLLQVQKVMV